MTFQLLCATMIALLFGVAVTFSGYRLFIVLLPIWGFFFGFGLGGQTMQYLLGSGFLATTTGWVVGFIVGVVFAVLSYMFYSLGVAILGASMGYALGVSIMLWIGFSPGLITWLVGMILAALLFVVTLLLNVQKYMVIISTSVLGAGLLIGTMMLGVVGVSLVNFLENPISVMLQDSPLWTILFLALVVGGILVQLRAAPVQEIDGYSSPV